MFAGAVVEQNRDRLEYAEDYVGDCPTSDLSEVNSRYLVFRSAARTLIGFIISLQLWPLVARHRVRCSSLG
jgi:hypothetical protein